MMLLLPAVVAAEWRAAPGATTGRRFSTPTTATSLTVSSNTLNLTSAGRTCTFGAATFAECYRITGCGGGNIDTISGTGNGDSHVFIWDGVGGTCTLRDGVGNLSMFNDADIVLSSADSVVRLENINGTLRVWLAAPGREISVLDWAAARALNTQWVTKAISASAVTLDGDGKYLLTGCAGGNLDTLNGTTDGDFIILAYDGIGGTCTVRHNGGGSGNLRLPSDADIVLSSANDYVRLIHRGSVLIAASRGAATPAVSEVWTSATVSGTAITVPGAGKYRLVDCNGGNLDTINGTTDGDVIFLTDDAVGDACTVQDGVGNIRLANNVDVTLTADGTEYIMLINNNGALIDTTRPETTPQAIQPFTLEQTLQSGARSESRMHAGQGEEHCAEPGDTSCIKRFNNALGTHREETGTHVDLLGANDYRIWANATTGAPIAVMDQTGFIVGGGTIGPQRYEFGCVAAASTPRYVSPDRFDDGCIVTEDIDSGAITLATRAGTAKNLYCATDPDSDPATGNTVTLEIRINGVDQNIQCDLTETVNECSDTSSTASVAAGDDISMSIVQSSAAAFGRVICAFEVES